MGCRMNSLPMNPNAERSLLGSILLDPTHYPVVAGAVGVEDFGLERNRRIYRHMTGLHEAGAAIDRITLTNALMTAGELDACGGLEYICELDEGLPRVLSVDGYARIVRDKSLLRQIIQTAHVLELRATASDADPGEILAEAGTKLLGLSQKGAESTLETPGAIIEAAGGLQAYLTRSEQPAGSVASGYRGLDLLMGGFRPGKLYVLAARPAMGKTALALNIAERVAVGAEDGAVLIFSLEMDKQSLVDRLICSRARVNSKRFELGFMNGEEKRRTGRAAGEIAACDRLLIDDHAVTDTREIHAKIRKFKARRKVGLVVVDYLGLLLGGDDAHRVAEASRVSRDFKLIAKDCDVPMLVLSQLSRKCEERSDKRPLLSDLRETGAIEQDADAVAMLYRGEVYEPDREDLRGLAELILRKQRGGPLGTVPLVWLGEMVRFEDMTREVA